MIMQIFKKDWKLLWPVVVLVATLRLLAEWMVYGSGLFGDELSWAAGGDLIELAAAVGWVVLVAAVVHQEPIPGTREDWLIRPIARPRLLCAKLLFLVVTVHAPLFVINATGATASGFSIGAGVTAATGRAVSNFAIYTLAIVALASVTRNLMELLIAGVGLILLVFVSQAFFGGISGDWYGAASGTGYEWIGESARLALVSLCALVVIGLQYLRRGLTAWSRAVVVLGAVVPVAFVYLPWETTWAVQQALSRAGNAVDVTIEADTSDRAEGVLEMRAKNPSFDDDAVLLAVRAARSSLRGADSDESVLQGLRRGRDAIWSIELPLTISGLPAGGILWSDRSEVRLIDAEGDAVFAGVGDELQIDGGAGVRRARQSIPIPPDVYRDHTERELRLEIDYWFTLLRQESRMTLPAASGVAMNSGGTRCSTRFLRYGGPAVRFECLSVVKQPSCFAVALAAAAEERRERRLVVCSPDYAPYRRSSNLFDRFGINVPLNGVRPQGGGIDGSSLADWVIDFETYQAHSRFKRRLVVPAVRLADWLGHLQAEDPAREGRDD